MAIGCEEMDHVDSARAAPIVHVSLSLVVSSLDLSK